MDEHNARMSETYEKHREKEKDQSDEDEPFLLEDSKPMERINTELYKEAKNDTHTVLSEVYTDISPRKMAYRGVCAY